MPQDPEPLIAIGNIYNSQHRWPLAEDAFNRALVTNQAGLSSREAQGRALAGLATARWEQGNQSQAVELWENALAAWHADPNRDGQTRNQLSRTRIRLALAYLDLDRFADAEALLSQELANSDNPAAHLYRGMIWAVDDTYRARHALGDIADDAPTAVVATRDYLLAALDSADTASSGAEAAKLLGLAMVQIGEWQLAEAALKRALILDPHDAEAMAYLGHTRAQLGRPAYEHLATAVENKPDWPLGHYLLGLYLSQQGLYSLATEEFQAALRLDPGNAQAQVDLGRAYVGKGQYLAAEAAFKAAVEAEPDDLTFHLALAHFYSDHAFRVTEQGIAAARAAADLAPDSPETHDVLGWMHFLAGNPHQARLHLESAVRLAPELVSAHYHLGILHNAMGKREPARFAFLRVIDLDTDGFYRLQAQAALRGMNQTQQ
jgi:tetratricopeptide (TPR) repeat protein